MFCCFVSDNKSWSNNGKKKKKKHLYFKGHVEKLESWQAKRHSVQKDPYYVAQKRLYFGFCTLHTPVLVNLFHDK